MSNLFLLTLLLLYYATFGKEKDIYHVITGEDDVPYKKSLDPVYYVGVYDKKPKSIPTKYEIEIMTADSGKRFTCIVPRGDGSTSSNEMDETKAERETDPILSNNEEEEEEDVILNNEDENIAEPGEQDEYFEDEPAKTAEELLQEADTLDNRDRYMQELLVYAQNAQQRTNRNKKSVKKPHCYFSREGYWNYELCLYDKIRQFHGNKNKRNPNIKLGDFAAYIDVSKILMNDESYPYLYLKDIYGIPLFENTEKNFAHLLYIGGEAKRESLVTIQCSTAYGKRTKDGIIKLTEPKIHHYHFIFIFKAVCEYRAWLQREYNIYDETNDELAAYSNTDDNNPNDIHSPQSSNTFIDNAIHDTSSSAQLLAKKNINPNSDDVSLLLSPLLDLANSNRCLLLKQGWWTVEFCYGKFIRQIHLEAKKQKNKKGQIIQSLTEWDIKQEHVIGTWQEGKVFNRDNFVIHKNVNDPARTYASIIYGNGDECDLTKQPRQTEIQFRCGLNIEHSELIKSREDPSCEYKAQIETPLLCGHPDFKIPSAPSYEILCYPFDEKEFVEPASTMKVVVDQQLEKDSILRMVTNAARQKYMEREKKEKEEEGKKEDGEKVDDDGINNENKPQHQKIEL